VASPILWKPKRASPAAPGVKPLRLQPFGRAPAGAGFEAAPGALPKRALAWCHLPSQLIPYRPEPNTY